MFNDEGAWIDRGTVWLAAICVAPYSNFENPREWSVLMATTEVLLSTYAAQILTQLRALIYNIIIEAAFMHRTSNIQIKKK